MLVFSVFCSVFSCLVCEPVLCVCGELCSHRPQRPHWSATEPQYTMRPVQRPLLSSTPSLLLRSFILLSLSRKCHISAISSPFSFRFPSACLSLSVCRCSLNNFWTHLGMNLHFLCLLPLSMFIFHLPLHSLFSFNSHRLLRNFSLPFSLTLPQKKIIYGNEWASVERERTRAWKEDTVRKEWRPSQLADLWLRDQRMSVDQKRTETRSVMHLFFLILKG